MSASGHSSIVTTKPEFALEGSVFIGGAVVQWLRDGLGAIQGHHQVRETPRFLRTCAPTQGSVGWVSSINDQLGV